MPKSMRQSLLLKIGRFSKNLSKTLFSAGNLKILENQQNSFIEIFLKYLVGI